VEEETDMRFREQLQMTNNDLRYIYRTGNAGTGSGSPSRDLESTRIKVEAGLWGTTLLVAQGSSLTAVSAILVTTVWAREGRVELLELIEFNGDLLSREI
jgi:hypothetical protein